MVEIDCESCTVTYRQKVDHRQKTLERSDIITIASLFNIRIAIIALNILPVAPCKHANPSPYFQQTKKRPEKVVS